MSTFAALVLLSLVSIVVADGQAYKAAVLKHDSKLIHNIESYLNLLNNKIYEASIQKADIVVIPELNVAQSLEFFSEIPDTNEVVPCTWNNEMPIRHLSCAAKKSQIYVAVNLLEKPLRSDVVTYSTVIVLDRKGKIISKVSNIFDKNSNRKIINKTFKTDFNATFEHLSYNDMYDSSSYDSSIFENTKNFIVWMNWKSDHTVSSACTDSKSWIYGRSLNLLAAEIDHPMNMEKNRMCNGKFSIENHHESDTKETELVLAILNKEWCSDNAQNTNKSECLRFDGVENKIDNDDTYTTIKNFWEYIFSKLQIISFFALIYVLEML